MKIATITWVSYYNYGTILQSYALQKYIKSLGYENNIIDDSYIVNGAITEKKNRIIFFSRLFFYFQRVLVHFNRIIPSYRAFYIAQKNTYNGINKFKKEYLTIDYNTSDFIMKGGDYDIVICGSDQIWSPISNTRDSRCYYFASFFNRKKTSYAPSIGVNTIPERDKEFYKKMLSSFSCVSVREDSGKYGLEELINKTIDVVVDPTLLLDKEDWESILPRIQVQDKFVIGYFLTYNSLYIKSVSEYAKKNNLKFYLFVTNFMNFSSADKLISGGPLEFLSYIANAEMVFTDSFHGTIFSSIFETPFYTFKRFNDKYSNSQNSRVVNLLGKMGVSERLLDENSILKINNDKVDFCTIRSNLHPFIIRSKDFLKSALSD